jgi:uncharacterized repeat protein (TIGR03803 family)
MKMKKFMLSIGFFFAGILCIQAQVLWGTTKSYGAGAYGGGAINKFISATNNMLEAKSFEGLPSNPRYASLMQASDGKLYGMTETGGYNGYGAIFSYNPLTSVYTTLKYFDGANGATPHGSLVQTPNGKLYGMTSSGGNNYHGVIFSYDPDSSIYTKLIDLDVSIGIDPYGSLFYAKDGKLYGMTNSGGSFSAGTIFSLDPLTVKFTKLYDLNSMSGAHPYGNLIQASNGKLYGMTFGGSVYVGDFNGDYGTIFSFDPLDSVYTKLLDLSYHDGSPIGSLIEASDGNLYGLSRGGITHKGERGRNGILFSFNFSTSTFNRLIDFDSCNLCGAHPEGSLLQGIDGKLYGMTNDGGRNGKGVIFSFDILSTTFTKIKDFGDNKGEGNLPSGSMIQATDGMLYGMTTFGGISTNGVVFSLDPSTTVYKELKDFSCNETGSNPQAGLIKAIDAKLYGMTNDGGRNGKGVIFSFDPATSLYTTLLNFKDSIGTKPTSILTQANDGKLYGMTNLGGSGNAGVIFSFDPAKYMYKKLMDFDYSIGAKPYGSLIQANDGKLYGITSDGGPSGAGVIFSYDPVSLTYKKLMDFDYSNGAKPYGSLIQANDGNLYGMTSVGGRYGGGIIFSYDPVSLTYKKLMDFEGYNPYGSLIEASDGKLYGMVSNGGVINAGYIFFYDPLTTSYSKLFDFKSNNNGYLPLGNLLQASNGIMYGSSTIGNGYSNIFGLIFSFDPVTLAYTKLKDYKEGDIRYPYYGSVFIEVKECTTDTTYYRDADKDGYGNFNDSLRACSQPEGYVKEHTDCNDNSAAIHAPITYYRDADKDGFGDASHSISVCESVPPAGYVTNNYDCKDYDRPGQGRDIMVVMCHHGKEQCVKVKEINKKLHNGWTLGPCNKNECEPYETPMCHDGKEDCIKIKDVKRKLREGWTVGHCSSTACDSDEILMCHNGKKEYVKTKDVQKKLEEKGGHWSIGACICGNEKSSNTMEDIESSTELRKKQSTPTTYKLSNYPNPFAGTSTVKYELPFDSKVSIKVYDVMGSVVATLVDENKKAGTYTLQYKPGQLSKSYLYLRIIASSKEQQFEQTNKMIQLQ